MVKRKVEVGPVEGKAVKKAKKVKTEPKGLPKVKKETHNLKAPKTVSRKKPTKVDAKPKTRVQKGKEFIQQKLKFRVAAKALRVENLKQSAIEKNRGVVMFSNIPHGFYEEQIKKYCQQFGKVTGVHLPRSKSGRYRGYAFVEFYEAEVAKIVAETMNNYLMFKKIMKTRYIAPEEQRPWVFRYRLESAKQRHEKNIKAMHEALEKPLAEKKAKKYKLRMRSKVRKMREKLNKLQVGNYRFQVV